MKELTLPALNVQAPWAELVINGKKTVETRFYPLPKAYVGKRIFILETPGASKLLKRRVVGTVIFSESFEYRNRTEFYKDKARHLVGEDSDFSWKHGETRKKWGWVVQTAEPISGAILGPQKTGIVFTKKLRVSIPAG